MKSYGFQPRLGIQALGLGLAGLALTVYLPRLEPAELETQAHRLELPNALVGEAGPPGLFYLNGTELHHITDAGRKSMVLDMGVQGISAAPRGEFLATVKGSGATSENDFVSNPRIVLKDVGSRRPVELGPGFSPRWSHDASKLAFLRPVDTRNCFGEFCQGETEVVVAMTSGERFVVSPHGSWSILGWLGDRVLIVDAPASNDVWAVSLTGNRALLDIPRGRIWDGSPDGRWLVTSDATGAWSYPIFAGIVGPPNGLDTGGRRLGEGAWSHDARTIAAVAVDGSLTGENNIVITFSPSAPEVAPVPGSRGAMGQLLWGPDSKTLVFAAMAPKGRLEARRCVILTGDCVVVMEWSKNVTLLKLDRWPGATSWRVSGEPLGR